MNTYRWFILSLIVAVIVNSAGCTQAYQKLTDQGVRKGVSSSLVDYLYPKGEQPPPPDKQLPELKLPLRIGLAFVPSTTNNTIFNAETPVISEAYKTAMLTKVKDAFESKNNSYIQEIVVIPDAYISGRKGFEHLQQVSRLYGVDIVTLVSYDQIAYTDDTKASLLYWTVVGAYFIEGSKNQVQTLVDAAVFDVKSQKLLFRAPGIDKMQSSSTLIDSVDITRNNRQTSFDNAVENMIVNLDTELGRFQERVKKEKFLKVSYKGKTYQRGSAGSSGVFMLVILLIISILYAVNNKKIVKKV